MVQIKLTKQQLNKLHKGQAFQMSYKQIVNGEGAYDVDIDVDRKTHNKIHRNVSNGKGFRIPKGIMNAGAKLAKQGANAAANYAVNEGSKRLGDAINNSSYVPDSVKGDLVNLSKTGLNAVKTTGLNAVNNRIDAANGQGFGSFVKVMKKAGQVLAPVAKQVAKQALPVAAQMAGNYIGGPGGGQMAGAMAREGVKGLGFKKGSPEMKAKMARLRAMKGRGMFSNMAKAAVKAAAPTLIKAGSKMATDALINRVNGQGVTTYRHIGIGPPSKAQMAALRQQHGEGIYKAGFNYSGYRNGLKQKFNGDDTVSTGKFINNRDASNESRVLINGIDTVGSGFSPYGY